MRVDWWMYTRSMAAPPRAQAMATASNVRAASERRRVVEVTLSPAFIAYGAERVRGWLRPAPQQRDRSPRRTTRTERPRPGLRWRQTRGPWRRTPTGRDA